MVNEENLVILKQGAEIMKAKVIFHGCRAARLPTSRHSYLSFRARVVNAESNPQKRRN